MNKHILHHENFSFLKNDIKYRKGIILYVNEIMQEKHSENKKPEKNPIF